MRTLAALTLRPNSYISRTTGSIHSGLVTGIAAIPTQIRIRAQSTSIAPGSRSIGTTRWPISVINEQADSNASATSESTSPSFEVAILASLRFLFTWRTAFFERT